MDKEFPKTIELGCNLKFEIESHHHLMKLYYDLCEDGYSDYETDPKDNGVRLERVKAEVTDLFRRLVTHSWREYVDLEFPSSST